MKILHHVAFHATAEQRAVLKALGVTTHDCPNTSLPGDTGPPFIKLDADDANPNWPKVHRLLQEWTTAPILTHTVFTQREQAAARWLRMTAWGNGYPQPQKDMKFFEATFDMKQLCPRCRLPRVQTAPFRIKGEPKWGRRGIMSFLWLFDEHFVPPAVWETIFKPFGIPCRPVLNRAGKELETVVQLVVEEEVDLIMDYLSVVEVCDHCSTRKYTYSQRGPYPPLAREPAGAMVKTRQPFGDGWGMHGVLVSQELRRAMLSHQLRGVEFIPVQSHLDAIEA